MISLPSSPDGVILRWPTEHARAWLEDFLRRAAADPNVLAVVAVGSAVRSGVPSDDLDLIAICRDQSRLEERAPIEVDLRSYDVGQLESKLSEGADLLTWSVKYGEPLYDPKGVWEDLVHAWEGRLPLPDVSVARARAKAARRQLDAMLSVGDDNAAIDLRVSYLTHLARAALSEAGVYPASRPELPAQLGAVGESDLAGRLQDALDARIQRRAADTAV